MDTIVRILPEVQRAFDDGRPVVALESSVLAQGLPIPRNREAAQRMTAAIERHGAVAAITGVVAGQPTVGLTADELERFLRRDGVRKVSSRDVGLAIAQRADGATTVAASLMLAQAAGAAVFATGGIGGVHFEPAFDESADLAELARTPMVVVCAGAKSILDLRATFERLETLGVPVMGYRTDELPGFYTADTGIALGARADDVGMIAAAFVANRALRRPQALLIVQAPPEKWALDRSAVEVAVAAARREARDEGVQGAAVTPHLLAAISRLTAGASVDANLALLEANAELAARIAASLAADRGRTGVTPRLARSRS